MYQRTCYPDNGQQLGQQSTDGRKGLCKPIDVSPLRLSPSSYSVKSQTIRLKAAGTVSAAYIKSLVWGEDALAFVDFVSAGLNVHHLVVADQDVHVASTKVTISLPYEAFAGILKNNIEFIGIYPDQRIQCTSS